MNKLFHPFLDQLVMVYLDDIVAYSTTLEQHVQHLKQVFQVLCENELYLKAEKCSFSLARLELLRHRIKDGKLMMDLVELQAIQDWMPPTKVSDLRSFLGLMNYYRRFIKGYSGIALPLNTDLFKKNHTCK